MELINDSVIGWPEIQFQSNMLTGSSSSSQAPPPPHSRTPPPHRLLLLTAGLHLLSDGGGGGGACGHLAGAAEANEPDAECNTQSGVDLLIC